MAVSMMKNPVAGLDAGWKEALKKPLVMVLAAALVMQLLLAAVIGSGGGMEPAATDAPLLDFTAEDITALEITDAEGTETVALSRAGDGWVLSALGDFPADGAKVDALLESLAGLKRPLPVATSEAARARFKVADDDFERRLTLKAGGDTVATLIAGDSPGFRRVFARTGGEDAVYDVRLALFDLSNAVRDWMQRERLQLEQEKIIGIAAADWSLKKDGDAWTLAGSDKAPDAAAVDQVLQAIAFLGYDGVLGTEDKPEYGQSEPVMTVDVALEGGESRSYIISKRQPAEQSDQDGPAAETYVLKAADSPYYFELQSYMLDGLLDLDRARLLGEEEGGEEAEAGQAPAEGGGIESASEGAEAAIAGAAGAAPPAESADPEMAQGEDPGLETGQGDTVQDSPAGSGEAGPRPAADPAPNSDSEQDPQSAPAG